MKNRQMSFCMALLLSLSFLTPLYSQPASANAVPPDMGDFIVPGKVIVKLKENVKSADSIQGYSAKQLSSFGAQYKMLDVPVEGDVADAVKELKKNPDIEYAEPVFINKAIEKRSLSALQGAVQAAATVQLNDPEYANQWSLGVTDITYAWDKVSVESRAGVTIAVVDSGVNGTHEDLQGALVEGFDAIANIAISPTADSDDLGHGTFVAGTAAAISNNAKGVAGVAGGAKIMPVKVLDGNGAGTVTAGVAGIRWAADHGADVINLSLGRPRYVQTPEGIMETYSRLEAEAIQYAVSKGAVVIAASGNDSNHWVAGQPANMDSSDEEAYQANVSYPAALPDVVAVGAVGKVGNDIYIADFSNIDSTLDVVAPGVKIRSTNDNGQYSDKNGTSFAAPFVSGLAALIKAANPNLTPGEVSTILEDTAKLDGLKDPAAADITKAQYFGSGLVNGRDSFSLPRLKLTKTSGELDALGELTFDLATADYNGSVFAAVYSKANVIVKMYTPSIKDFKEVKRTVVESTYKSIQVPMTDAGVYLIYADDSAEHNFVRSEYVVSKILPGAPVANLASGSYKEKQTVSLTSATPEATIYYTLNGSNPSSSALNVTTFEYTGPLSVGYSQTVKAIAVKNGVQSDVSSFSYTIDSNNDRKRGGGGGGGGYVPPTAGTQDPAAPDSTPAPIVVKGDDEQLKKELQSADTTKVTIDAKSDAASPTLQVEFSASVLQLAADKNKSIVIDTGRHLIELPAGAIPVKDGNDIVKLTITSSTGESSLSKKPAQAKEVSSVYDFSLSMGGGAITSFAKPLIIQWKINLAEQVQIAKLGVYYFNEGQQNWDYVGGDTTADGVITFNTDHFSQYVVMEYNKTFEDMTQHWATADVELLASKHIVTGISDTAFGPEQKLTRAEFAALLVRTLGIKAGEKTGIFADVKQDDWFHATVYQAYGAKLIEGLDSSTFAPNEPITREQMAVMIMRAYSVATGKDESQIQITQEVKYADEGVISSWARSSVRHTNGAGLMSGFPDGTFKPDETATRAQAAKVIKQLSDLKKQ